MTDLLWMLLGGILGIAATLMVVAFRVWGRDRTGSEPEAVDEPEFKVVHLHLSDWGPDFTGEDGTLHRWRWMLWLPGHDGARAISDPPEVGVDVPLFLGNAATEELATQEATEWAREHGYFVVVD